MSIVAKLTEKQALEVCYVCIDYLTGRCLMEKGLFRNPPSVVEIRKLRLHILNERQPQAILTSDLDPHLVAGVLQLTLKDMQRSVFDRIYPDMMASANESADFSRNKADVISWICRFNKDHFDFVQSMMAFLHQLGTTAGNDANISQLVFIFAPLLCRPSDSAYMSVRHMEDLRKLRPTLQVIVENYVEVFRESRPIMEENASNGDGGGVHNSNSDMESYSTDSKDDYKNQDQKSFSPSQEGPLSKREGNSISQKNVPMNLQVSTTSSAPTDVNDASMSNIATRQMNYQSKEWNKLEQLVFSLSESFLKESFQFFNPTKDRHLSSDPSSGDNGMVMSNENDLMSCTIETYEPGNVGFGGGDVDSPSKDMGLTDDGRYWTQSGSTGAGNLFSSNSSSRAPSHAGSSGAATRASNRRKLVHECRTLRQQISKFEKDWAVVHNRNPKGGEKGHMQPVYSKYRDMKREIRSSAAVDIQRLVRAFISRSKIRNATGFFPTAPAHYARSPPKHSSSPKKSNFLTDVMTSKNTSSRGEFDQQSMDSNLWKSVENEDAISSSGNETNEKVLYSKYKDLLLQKRTLKRRLKRFDEEFAVKYNRQPKKTDKEVMRPHYQKYHEVRNEMQVLKAKIEREVGSLPVELQEVPEGESSSSHSSRPSTVDGEGSGRMSRSGGLEQSASTPYLPISADTEMNSEGGHGEEEEDELMTRFDDSGRRGSSLSESSAGAAGNLSSGWLSAARSGAEPSRLHSGGNSGVASTSSTSVANPEAEWNRASSNSPADIEALQKEKRQLHIVLKAYERDFNQIHGRHVMKPEDIAPVASEYQRYKELKKRLKDL